ncbi:MAG TPA: hypothetical protein VFQ91_01905 [Bryobacteraceae bacterium]|nr:hypothetical protein [Bryobacteraceae bacterium]
MRDLRCVLAAMAAFLFSVPALALSSYERTVVSATSTTITNAQHGFGSKYLAVLVYDSESIRVQPGSTPGYSYSIDPSTYSVTVTFSSSFTGTVKLIGPFTGTTSSNSDFQVSIGVESGAGILRVCGDCTSVYYALRSWGGKSWYSAGPTTLTLTAAGGGGVWRSWLENQKVVFGYSYSGVGGAATCNGLPCEVRFNVSDYPSGVIPLGSAQRSSVAGQHWVGTPNDDRP